LNKPYFIFLYYLNHVSLFTPGVRRALSDPELFISHGKVRPLQEYYIYTKLFFLIKVKKVIKSTV